MSVIDASSLAKYVNREPNWEEVRKYLMEGCITIPLALKEVSNSIWKRVIRGELDKENAERVFKAFIENLMVKIIEQDDLYEDAFKLALENKATVYDSLYVVLASKLNSELITSDKKQGELAELNGVKVIYIP